MLGFLPLTWLGFQYLTPIQGGWSQDWDTTGLTTTQGQGLRGLTPNPKVLGSSSHPGLGSHGLISTKSWSYKGHFSKCTQLVPHPHLKSYLRALPFYESVFLWTLQLSRAGIPGESPPPPTGLRSPSAESRFPIYPGRGSQYLTPLKDQGPKDPPFVLQ